MSRALVLLALGGAAHELHGSPKDGESAALEARRTTETCKAFTYASDFGLAGDGKVDDYPALQAAIDSAASNDDCGGTVILPKGNFLTKTSLTIPGGVTVRGQGYGSSPLAISFDSGGSVIGYCGTQYAVVITGHSASLENVAVYDWRYPVGEYCDSVKAAGGVLIDADAHGVESTSMDNVLIYWFMGGTALTLRAQNGGIIAFSRFVDVKIRHAQSGILLSADEDSVCNSNAFVGFTVWGGIDEYGLKAEGPGPCNMNTFYACEIEPSATELAHVYVTGSKTNVRLLDVRLEGTAMSELDKPLVIIDDSSYGNVMTGSIGHTNIKYDANRNPGVDLISAKTVPTDPAPLNVLWNAAFNSYDAEARSLAGWKTPGTNWNIEVLPDDEALYADHQVLRIDKLSYGGAFKFEPDQLPRSPAHSFVTFGIYARSSVPSSISAAMRYESGSIISSSSHSGSGDWEFIAMSALYDKDAPYFYFSIDGDVDVTAPTFVYGSAPATPGASLMSSSGAKMAGTLSMGLAKAYPPPEETKYYWVLPNNSGNYFEVDTRGEPSKTIIRLNYRTADRFPRGTVVTLLFGEAGHRVKDSGYIKLKGGTDFISVENSAITLISHGSASWTEVSRNA